MPLEGNTNLILGEVVGKLKGVEERIVEQNETFKSISREVNSINKRVTSLPCDVHGQTIGQLAKWRAEVSNSAREEEVYAHRIKKRYRRELIIALIAAIVTGFFTVLGVWITINAI